MKIIAWNINGIKAMLKKEDLVELINNEKPDIFCLGETINNTKKTTTKRPGTNELMM